MFNILLPKISSNMFCCSLEQKLALLPVPHICSMLPSYLRKCFVYVRHALDPACSKLARFRSSSSHAIPHMGSTGHEALPDLSHTSWGQAGCHFLGLQRRGRACDEVAQDLPTGLVRCLTATWRALTDTHNSAIMHSFRNTWRSHLIFKVFVPTAL